MTIKDGRKKSVLNFKQRLFVEAYVTNGGNATAASRAAGYSEKNSSATARELMKSQKVQDAIAAEHEKVRNRTAFTLEKAMFQAAEDRQFAREKGNAMAAVKASELCCKLAGLLIDRHDISLQQLDLSAVLIAAESRVRSLYSHQRFQAEDGSLPATVEFPKNKEDENYG